MAAIGFLLVIGFLALPFIATIWVYQTGRRLDRVQADLTAWLRRIEKALPQPAAAGATAAAQTSAAPAPAATAAPAPADEAFTDLSAAPPAAAAPIASPSPRRDSVFADQTVFTDESGETWMEISDVPAAPPAYFSDTGTKPAAGEAAVPNPSSAAPAQTDTADRLWRWLAENWMLATGALFVFLSISWLVRYALIEDLITQEMRIGAGFALGLAGLLIGQLRMRRYAQQGAIFLLLGAGVLMLTVFAARALYGYFTPPVAIAMSFLTAAYVTLQALRHRLPVLSYAGLFLAMVAPAAVQAPSVSFFALFGYLAAVLAATLWVVLVTGWRKNILVALLGVIFYSLPFLGGGLAQPEKFNAMLTIFGFAGVFFVADLVGHFRAVRNSLADILMPLLMALLLIVWIFDVAEAGSRSQWLGLWAGVFSLGSLLLHKRAGARAVFATYLCVSILLLFAMAALELRGPQLVLLLTAVSTLLTVLAQRVLGGAAPVRLAAATLAIPLLMGASSFAAKYWAGGVLHAHALVMLALAVVPLGLAFYFSRVRRADLAAGRPETLSVREIETLVLFGTLYGFGLVWRALHAALPSADFATAAAMIVYSIIGIACYVGGYRRENMSLRNYGAGVLALVIGRLLLVDLPNMPAAARITMFFGVGVLLLATAFVRYRKNDAS